MLEWTVEETPGGLVCKARHGTIEIRQLPYGWALGSYEGLDWKIHDRNPFQNLAKAKEAAEDHGLFLDAEDEYWEYLDLMAIAADDLCDRLPLLGEPRN